MSLSSEMSTDEYARLVQGSSLSSASITQQEEQRRRLDWPSTIEEVNALDMSFMNDSWIESMVRDGMRAIVLATMSTELKRKEIDAWEYLSKYSPPASHGFMFSSDPIMEAIQRHMEIGHSGSSMGGTMRQLEFIAKNGFSKYRES